MNSTDLATNVHKIVWMQNPNEKYQIKVDLQIANKKLTKSADTFLNVRMSSIYFEYRKEYIEFFMAFFESSNQVADEVKMKAMEEYERLKE